MATEKVRHDKAGGDPDVGVDDGMRAVFAARQRARVGIAAPGDWTTGPERVEAWEHVRDARSNALDRSRKESISPNAILDRHANGRELNAVDVEIVHRVTSDPGRLTQAWADEAMSEIGEERYTELVAVTAIAQSLDTFEAALGLPLSPLPNAHDGAPTRQRPDDVGPIGAWVSQTQGPTRANVSRTFSLVPTTNVLWRELVDSHYARGHEFMDMCWERALSRPQTELVAARTTGLNECFY